MKRRKYRFDYRLQIEHQTGNSPRHHHTLEVSFCIGTVADTVVPFDEMNRDFERLLSSYQNVYLNERSEFHGNTTIENTGEVLCEHLNAIAEKDGYDLYHFEIGESPLRMYIISDML